MARDFDGTNDRLSMGSDASIDDFAALTFAGWFRRDTLDAIMLFAVKGGATNATHGVEAMNTANSNILRIRRAWSTTNGAWYATGVTYDTALHHIVVSHAGATTDDALIWIDGVAQGITEASTPSGTRTADAANTLAAGETTSGASDLNGVIQNFIYHNAVFTGAEANRAYWWGRPFGGLKVYHPLFTDKVNNEGSATANITATGTTVVGIGIKGQRPGFAAMGMGVGF